MLGPRPSCAGATDVLVYATVIGTLSFLVAAGTLARLLWTERDRVSVFTRRHRSAHTGEPAVETYRIVVVNLSRRDAVIDDVGLQYEPGDQWPNPFTVVAIRNRKGPMGVERDLTADGPELPLTLAGYASAQWQIERTWQDPVAMLVFPHLWGFVDTLRAPRREARRIRQAQSRRLSSVKVREEPPAGATVLTGPIDGWGGQG